MDPEIFIKIIENPRISDYEMGKAKCDLCGGRPSILLDISTEDDWNDLVICKACLTRLSEVIDWAILKQVKT